MPESWFEALLKKLTPESSWYPQRILSETEWEAIKAQVTDKRAYIECIHVHPNSCTVNHFLIGFRMLERAYKIYIIIHLVPHLLFKKDKFSKKAIISLLKNIGRTLVFFTVYAVLGNVCWCRVKEICGKHLNPWVGQLFCMFGASMIFIERNSRWSEFALNVSPRFLESLPIYLGKQRMWPTIPNGHNILLALSMGIVSYVYYTAPVSIKKQFLWLVRLIMGDHVNLEDIEMDASDYPQSPASPKMRSK